jgi:hypothetical protein
MIGLCRQSYVDRSFYGILSSMKIIPVGVTGVSSSIFIYLEQLPLL